MNKKIFISGPMSGMKNYNVEAFNTQSDLIKRQGDIPLNPAVIAQGMPGLTERDYMIVSNAMLQCADAIVQLPGWELSLGAQAEYATSQKFELPISEVEAFIVGDLPERATRILK